MTFVYNITADTIRQRLVSAPQTEEINPYPTNILRRTMRPAAVLVPLFWQDSQWQVLYIRRAAVNGDIHSGQVAFPGGGKEPQDLSPEDTALREAQEETGLPSQQVRVLGRLPLFRTISNYVVTPVVAQIDWPFPLRLSHTEVSRVFHVPLQWLANPAHRQVRERSLANGMTIPMIYFEPYDGEVIWGATARITETLFKTLKL